MNSSSKIVIVVAVVLAIVVVITAYTVLSGALTPLEQRQDKTVSLATPYVEIQASTFNGDIVIETSTDNQIEVTYDVQAPQGHLNDIQTSTTNQTANGSTKIISQAIVQNNVVKANYRSSMTIRLPSTSQYNLTLSTRNGNIVKPSVNDVNVVAETSNGYVDITDNNATSIEATSLNGNINIHLSKDTLFKVDATTANGQVTYQGIAMNTTTQTATHLKGNTAKGLGHLNMTLTSANGNVTIEYSTA